MTRASTTLLSREERDERIRLHEQRLAPIIRPHLERHARGEKHPVHDFLFEYYYFRPAWLLRWSAGFGVDVEGEEPLLPDKFPAHRIGSAQYILQLLEATAARPPRFGCFGLHEWAMVYATNNVRHGQFPLRLSSSEIDEVVRANGVTCSHYDAFRFFTPEAVPLNRLQPAKSTRTENEQGGCLHANMDLYKWAFKFYPWMPSDLIADAFLFAATIREVDMRASPYDLSALGYEPIRIETAEGRAGYRELQERFSKEGVPIRARLIATYRDLIKWAGGRVDT